jgi:peptide/nickel transport system substrate-binding protein
MRTHLMDKAKFGTITMILVLLSTTFVMPFAHAQPEGALTPKYGGTLIVGVSSGWDLSTLNPNLGYVLPAASKIFNGLLEFDANLNPKPDLAESWEISKDGRTYTFHLVRNATFHDGTPVTSADVKFSIEHVLIPYDPIGKATWEPLESIETPDDYTVVIKLAEPSSSLLYMLSVGSGGLAVLPKHLYEGTDIPNNPYNQKPVGSGPFKFVSWEKGSQIVLERNENYFKKGLPYLDRIIIRIIADETALGLALENGEIDYVPVGLSFPGAKRLKTLENIIVTHSGREGLGVLLTLVMNLDNPILANQKVRQAIAYAIDRDLINERVYLNQQKVAQSLVSSTVSWAFNPDVQKYDYDPERANRLLDEAGYPKGPDGKRFSISVHNYAGLPDRIKMLEVIREQLRDVGIDLKIITLEGAAVSDAVYKNQDFDSLLVFMWTGPDPVPNLAQPLHSKQIGVQYGNAGGYKNERVDQLLDAAAQETDRKKEAQLLYELQDILARDLPIFPLFEAAIPSGYSNEFVGLGIGPWLPNDSLERVWWTGGKSDNIKPIGEQDASTGNISGNFAPIILVIVAIIAIGGGIGAYSLRRKSTS